MNGDDRQPDAPAGAAEIRAEMATVNSGSSRERELSRQLEDLYRRHHGAPTSAEPTAARPDAGPVVLLPPMPDGFAPATAAFAETNVRAERLAQLQAEREQFGNTTERNRALDLEIEDLLRKDFEAQQSYAEPDIITPASVRPELRGGATWDEAVVASFEQQAPGARVLEHIVADAHNGRERYADGHAAGDALEAKYGVEEAGRLAEDAMAYLHEFDKDGKIEASLKAQGQFFNPKLIVAAAQWWRRSQTQ